MSSGNARRVCVRWDEVVVRRVPRVVVVVVVVVVRAVKHTRESRGMPRGREPDQICLRMRKYLQRKNAEFLRASGSSAMGNHEAPDEGVVVSGASVDSRVSKARMASQVARARRRRTESSGSESSAA